MPNAAQPASKPVALQLQNVTALVYADRTEWSKGGEVYATRPHSGQRAMVKALRACGYRR